jgi:hypothetical protein
MERSLKNESTIATESAQKLLSKLIDVEWFEANFPLDTPKQNELKEIRCPCKDCSNTVIMKSFGAYSNLVHHILSEDHLGLPYDAKNREIVKAMFVKMVAICYKK